MLLKSYYIANNWTEDNNISGLGGWVSGIETTPDGRIVFVTSNTNVLGYWVENNTPYLNMDNHSAYVRVIAISPDGRYLATGSQDNYVIITEIATKQIIAEISFGWTGS